MKIDLTQCLSYIQLMKEEAKKNIRQVILERGNDGVLMVGQLDDTSWYLVNNTDLGYSLYTEEIEGVDYIPVEEISSFKLSADGDVFVCTEANAYYLDALNIDDVLRIYFSIESCTRV